MNSTDFDPGPLVPVECETQDGRPMLIFTREFRHSPEKVWKALTDPVEQREWAPYISDRNLGSEGAVTLSMNHPGPQEGLPSQVLRATPPKLLEFAWGGDILTWELSPIVAGTRLTLRQVCKAPDWVPKIAAGWHICLLVADRLMDEKPIGLIVGMDAMNYGWQRLHDLYAEKLGIEGTPLPKEMLS